MYGYNRALLPEIKKTEDEKFFCGKKHSVTDPVFKFNSLLLCLAVFFLNKILGIKFTLDAPFLRLMSHILMKQCQIE